jgi:hypothetical protein
MNVVSKQNSKMINKKGKIVLTILFLGVALTFTVFLSQCQQQTQQHAAISGNTYYVSKNGNNGDGKSWQTAWNELSQINWSVIQPGDTILLDGGRQSMTYTTAMTIAKSGLQDAPITIERASDAIHSGQVILFGGRRTPLPYCGQTGYTYQPASVTHGIIFGVNSWIIIDGMSWDGISMYGYASSGIDMTNNPSNDTIRNLEIYDNGNASQSGGIWSPNQGSHGVYLTGSNLTFERMDIHDNADDEFDTGPSRTVGGKNITINYSWLYVSREDPRTPGLPFNEICVHQDGYQIFDGGVQSGITVENSVLGPGLGDALILGQSLNSCNCSATVNNVTIKNNLIMNKGIQIMGYPGVPETGWIIDHVTVATFNTTGSALQLDGSGNNVTNSIFYGGQIWRDGYSNPTGNCQWNTSGHTALIGGQTVDPKFMTDVSSYTKNTPYLTIKNANYALQPTSPCKGSGSSITSVAQFLSIVKNQSSFAINSVRYSTTSNPTSNPSAVIFCFRLKEEASK